MSRTSYTLADIKEASLDFASLGDNTILSATAGKTYRIIKMVLLLASSTTVTMKAGSTVLTGAMTMDNLLLDDDGVPWFTTVDNEAFIINLGGAVQASGRIWYLEG